MTTYVSDDYQQKAWRTDELFPDIDSPEVETAVTQLQRDLDDFAAWQPKLSPDLSAADFCAILGAYENLTQQIRRLGRYGWLRFFTDTQDQKAQKFQAQVRQLDADYRNRTLFFELWWKSLAEATAVPLLEAAPDYRYWLESLRRQRPYTLSEAEEQIINLKNVNGRLAFAQLYDTITNRHTFQLRLAGEEETVLKDLPKCSHLVLSSCFTESLTRPLHRLHFPPN
jgi:oligoendopeptidase F